MIPVKSPAYDFQWGPSPSTLLQSPATIPVDFSPPLIAMVVVVATAFFIVTYFRLISRHLLPPVLRLLRRWRLRWRLWRHRRSFDPTSGDIESPPSYDAFESDSAFHYLSPYGLDDAVIKTIPLSIYMNQKKREIKKGSPESSTHDCAVCLLEFEDEDYVRTLPVCAHAFHVDCIDIWLRSHANCPLCRAGIFRPESPFIPLMASRIRPRLDEDFLQSILHHPDFRSSDAAAAAAATGSDTPTACEIGPAIDIEVSPARRNELNDHEHFNGRNFLLKRSYSFGFERNLAADRLITEATTASPWRYRRGNFWSKRTSPFSSISKPRVFSFRSYRGVKTPFFRRRGGFFPLSESNVRFSGGGGSSRRSKSMTSTPFFMRSSAVMFSSSRLRCGDPEALLSPERLNRR